MNPQSEIILEKMVDHFGLWEEPVTKNKIKLKKKTTLRAKKEENIALVHYSDSLKERRNEILICIEEIKSVDKIQTIQIQSSKALYVKSRQEELIYTKKVLREVSSSNLFIQAS